MMENEIYDWKYFRYNWAKLILLLFNLCLKISFKLIKNSPLMRRQIFFAVYLVVNFTISYLSKVLNLNYQHQLLLFSNDVQDEKIHVLEHQNICVPSSANIYWE